MKIMPAQVCPTVTWTESSSKGKGNQLICVDWSWSV